jgi:hypothetical protein
MASNTLSAVASGNGNTSTTNNCDGTLGSEFVIIDDFKISAGGGKSLPIEQALTVEQTNMPPKPLLLNCFKLIIVFIILFRDIEQTDSIYFYNGK